MRTRRRLFLLLVAVCAAASRGATALILGSWDPIKNIDDPHVQELGRWAVAEHVKQAPSDARLTFRRVTSGETQEFYGTNYRLVLVASRPSGGGGGGGKDVDGTHTAQVLEQEWVNSRTLVSFVPAN